MSTTLDQFQSFSHNPVNQAIFLINPTTPPSASHMTQRFWLSNTVVSMTLNILNQRIHTFQCFSIL